MEALLSHVVEAIEKSDCVFHSSFFRAVIFSGQVKIVPYFFELESSLDVHQTLILVLRPLIDRYFGSSMAVMAYRRASAE